MWFLSIMPAQLQKCLAKYVHTYIYGNIHKMQQTLIEQSPQYTLFRTKDLLSVNSTKMMGESDKCILYLHTYLCCNYVYYDALSTEKGELLSTICMLKILIFELNIGYQDQFQIMCIDASLMNTLLYVCTYIRTPVYTHYTHTRICIYAYAYVHTRVQKCIYIHPN